MTSALCCAHDAGSGSGWRPWRVTATAASDRSGGLRRLPVRWRPRGRGRKARRGDIRTAALLLLRRGAAQRLPDHAGGRGAQRGRLAAEPRLGLPGAAAARGRGPDPLAGVRRAQAVRAHRRGPCARWSSAASRQPGAVGADERRRQQRGPRAGQAHARGRLRVLAGDAHGQRGADRPRPARCWRAPGATSTGSSPTARPTAVRWTRTR